MNKYKVLGILATLSATTIYGLNHTIAKVVMPDHIGAFGFVQLRLVGAGFIFFVLSLFVKKQKIDTADYIRLFFAALLGMCINMLMFFKGLELSTPINSSVMITLTPIMVLILSYIFLNEKINSLKIIGIILGFSGAITLIIYGKKIGLNAPNTFLGNIMFFINATAFAAYLVLSKPLSEKYNTIILMKWMFLIGFVLSLPVTLAEFKNVQWHILPYDVIWRMSYVVICTTFLTYLLNMFALKHIPPSTVGAFIYLQPIIAIVYAVLTGNDSLDIVKIIAILLVFSGVYFASSKIKKT